ncbi:anthranilate synthase component I [Staphylococcus agnetis]|uniref:anthranilate synthase component I n=1 Tax=Staphylococcus agnetis TaxID=985762 RepID=UPI0004E3E4F9|nr:anthranilate synthase component I [Staphylococcus agnetis]KFE41100.1 anthranilate synthase component I [Staphylococcus agnetis]NJH64300.1 anthranilate synthase component I [Staphylococcus agnetis]NJH97081.1 anthranilate synthase component I [Staphylococcus agnetis]PTH47249.1 anthranilate synthase component I [Staphylococcus agnetis]PTH72138.1 anthranilate synthase component I [Staphylococcus agnetis]
MIIKYRVLNAPVNPETLARHQDKKIILESATTDQTKGRFSIVVFDTYGHCALKDDVLHIQTPDNYQQITTHPYEALKAYINQFKATIEEASLKTLPFVSGFMGYCSFDLVRHAFPVLKQQKITGESNDALFHMVESVYVFDHYKEQIYVIATNFFSKVSDAILSKRLDEMVQVFDHVELFERQYPLPNRHREIETNISNALFIERVAMFKNLIQQGDMFQVVPSRIYRYQHHFGAYKNALSYQLYQQLKRNNPSPYMFYYNMGSDIFVGSSPESFVKVKHQEVMTNPIAGTIQRGANDIEDAENATKLLQDEKELSEHRMLVDLGRNDILRIAQPGSLRIPKLMTIERYEHVMHIVSEVIGTLNQDATPMDVITSLLPTGTVSGAPKIRAIQRLYEYYPFKRGVYSGGIGYINCDHALDLALTIRTMVIDETHVNVEAGCGVVYDSVPEKELEETRLKAKSLLEVTL